MVKNELKFFVVTKICWGVKIFKISQKFIAQ